MDAEKLAKLHEFKQRTKEEIAQIELELKKPAPIGLQLPGKPVLWFRRFTDAETSDIYERSPKTEEEAQERARSNPTADEEARRAMALDLEHASLDEIKADTWLGMSRSEMIGLWGQLWKDTLTAEENVEKFRAHQPGPDAG